MPRFPARLHVLLASARPYGVVLRRGPSKSVCTLLWDRRKDTFSLGQWLRGHIYERRSDLSPDGRHLIYFALNGRWQSESKGAYSAVSRAPFLKALDMFPKGDTWQGGGLFTSNTSYWLNGGHAALRHESRLALDSRYRPQGGVGFECRGIYYPRLLRDGWTLAARAHEVRFDELDVFEKPVNRRWLLRKYAFASLHRAQGKSVYWDEHELVDPQGTARPCRDWEWADVVDGRLVWAEKGCLFATFVGPKGLGKPELLRDFNEMRFERVAAPY